MGLLKRQETVPAFILAAPRSGTTWLQRALNAHPGVYCTEHRLFGPHMDLVRDGEAPEPRLRITLDQYVKSSLQSAILDDLKLSREEFEWGLVQSLAATIVAKSREASGKPILVDKITPYPGTAKHVVKCIQAIWPTARFIFLLRDGRDVLTSGVCHWSDKTIVKPERNAGGSRMKAVADDNRAFTDAQIEEWAHLWCDIEEATHAIPAGQLITVRYEDMLADQGEVLARVLQHIGAESSRSRIETCTAASSFQSMSGGRKRGEEVSHAHIRKGVAGDWKQHFTPEDARQFDAIAGDLLIKLGYETNRDCVGAIST